MARELLFWALLLLALQPLRLRLAAVALLVIAHVDMSGPAFDSAGAVGWQNAFKALALPLWLSAVTALKLSRSSPGEPSRILLGLLRSPFSALWLLFVGYTAVAVLWSPYPLAGAKLAVALVSHTLVLVALLLLWHTERITPGVIVVALVLILGIAALQTFGLGNPYGTGQGIVRARFTSFAGPQSFAESLVCLGAILVWAPAGALRKLAAIGLLLGGALATGSRIGTAGALAAFGIWQVRRLDGRRLVVGAVAILSLCGLLVLEPVRQALARSRVGEVWSVVAEGVRGISQVGTFRWRDELYRCIWEDVRGRDSTALLFGTGSASIAVSGLLCEPRWSEESFSPNRVAHNEFLRVGYDLGLVGLLLGATLVAGLIAFGLRCFRRSVDPGEPAAWRRGPLASLVPLMLLALTFEAVLQGPLSPGSLGFLLVLSQAVALRFRSQPPAAPLV